MSISMDPKTLERAFYPTSQQLSLRRWSKSMTALLVTLGLLLSLAPAAAEDVTTMKAGPSVDIYRELMIKHLAVVNDSTRTTGCGAWTFCAMMTSLASTAPGISPSQITLDWLNWIKQPITINGDAIEGQPGLIDPIINGWPKLGNGQLDLTRAPFRLLAIVNRSDLMQAGDFGEGRLVYGLVTPSGQIQDFTVIFEYKMKTSSWSRYKWATEWHKLGGLGKNSAAYRNQLQVVTDRFARTVSGGRIHLSALRTNWLANQMWFSGELREFWQPFATSSLLPTTTKQSVRTSFACGATLKNWINANETALLNHTATISSPLILGGRDFARNRTWSNWDCGAGVPNNPWADVNHALLTCGGCHGGAAKGVFNGDAATHFFNSNFMVRPRNANQESTLHPFLLGQTLCIGEFFDHIHGIPPNYPCNVTFVQNDLQNRKNRFSNLLASWGISSFADPLDVKPEEQIRDPNLERSRLKPLTNRVH